MDKDMTNNSITFDVSEEVKYPSRGYMEMTAHMIFDVNLNARFMRKIRFVADGHKIDTPPSMEYKSVVSRDISWTVLIMANLNGLDVNCSGVQYEYLNQNQMKGNSSEKDNSMVFTRKD